MCFELVQLRHWYRIYCAPAHIDPKTPVRPLSCSKMGDSRLAR